MKLFITLLFLLSPLLNAYKIEAGVGLGALSYPDYIGSKSTNTLVTPIPYLRFYSSYLSLDKDGLSSKLFGLNDLSLDLSIGGSLPVNSDDNLLREGMQDLDVIIGMGPKIIYNIYENNDSKLEFQVPIRASLSTDFTNLRFRGITFHPNIKYTVTYSNLELVFRSGIRLADKDYHSYFYTVENQYIKQNRPQYNAKSGFGGITNKLSLTYTRNSWVLDAFVSYYDISHATFKDSPLVETHSALYLGTALSYVF